jgi:hypothetical protein
MIDISKKEGRRQEKQKKELLNSNIYYPDDFFSNDNEKYFITPHYIYNEDNILLRDNDGDPVIYKNSIMILPKYKNITSKE